MSETVNRVDQLFDAIRAEPFLESQLGATPGSLFMFDYLPEEQPHLHWLLRLLPLQLRDHRISCIDVCDCVQEVIQRRGRWDKLRQYAQDKGISKSVEVAKSLAGNSVVDAILDEVAGKECDIVLLSGFGDVSPACSPSALLSELNSRLPEATRLVALLPGIVENGKLLLCGSQDRKIPVFRYLKLA
jgi:hypothetical protein